MPEPEAFFYNKVKNLQGLEYGGEESVKCCGCNKELFVIMRVSDKSTEFLMGKFRVPIMTQYFVGNCPFCNDESWKIKIDGKCMIRGSHGKTVISDIDMDFESIDSAVLNKLKIVKDKNGDDGN